MNEIREEKQSQTEMDKKNLKVYTTPEFRKLGAMQRVTLGGSPGLDDSGAELSENPPPTSISA